MTDTPIAIIAGGAQGVSYACAEAICESGARILLADINADGVAKAAETLRNGTVGITCDMGTQSKLKRCSIKSKLSSVRPLFS